MSNKELPSVPGEEPLQETLPPESVSLAHEVVEVERAKVAVEAKAIEASNEQDKRIAEFHSRRIELDAAADQRRVVLATRVMVVLLTVVAIPAALFLYMVFWGNETQRQTALTILQSTGIAVAGYGVIHAISHGIRALANRRQR